MKLIDLKCGITKNRSNGGVKFCIDFNKVKNYIHNVMDNNQSKNYNFDNNDFIPDDYFNAI